eukprot:3969627-Heterocapsa_arctica.AAC.1
MPLRRGLPEADTHGGHPGRPARLRAHRSPEVRQARLLRWPVAPQLRTPTPPAAHRHRRAGKFQHQDDGSLPAGHVRRHRTHDHLDHEPAQHAHS